MLIGVGATNMSGFLTLCIYFTIDIWTVKYKQNYIAVV